MTRITGSGGELEKSAGNRWKKTGEGEGGIIGIESVVTREEDGEVVDVKSDVVDEYNCGGMFRAFVTGEGKVVCRVWREGEGKGMSEYVALGEGREYNLRRWVSEKIPSCF